MREMNWYYISFGSLKKLNRSADIQHLRTSPVTIREAISDLPRLDSGKKDESGHYWASYPKLPEDMQVSEYAKKAREKPPEGLSIEALKAIHAKGMISGFQPTKHTPQIRKRFASVPPGGRDRISKCPRLSWDSPSGTLRAGTGKDKGSYQSIRPIHPQEHRVISVREAARIQGFPDWFQFHRTKWHSFRMIGNSVSPYVSKAILSVFMKRMDAGQ